jgi:hypothetical protein
MMTLRRVIWNLYLLSEKKITVAIIDSIMKSLLNRLVVNRRRWIV